MARRRRRRYRIKPRGIVIIVLFLAIVILLVSCGISKIGAMLSDDSGKEAEKPKAEVTTEELSILCVGDIMAHEPQYRSAYDASTGTYDFTESFAYVRDAVQSADLALCNVETVFADREPQGYPTFNAPDELAQNIAETGFDVAITSNNHMLDQGTSGVERTLQVLRDQGLTTVGSRLTESENEYSIVDVNGIKVGIVGYTFETTGTGSSQTINGMAVPGNISSRICSFNPESWQTDVTRITDNMDQARNAGAQIIVCYLHWGEEYRTDPLDYQVKMAEVLAAENGADVIFASHPHILEKVETVYSETYSKNVPVYYSMGNFLSNQRAETLGENRRNTEDGMIAQVSFTITKENDKVTGIKLSTAKALPTWVSRVSTGGSKWKYEIIPLDMNYKTNKSIVSNGTLSRATTSLEASINTIGSGYTRDSEGWIVIFDAASGGNTARNTTQSEDTDEIAQDGDSEGSDEADGAETADAAEGDSGDEADNTKAASGDSKTSDSGTSKVSSSGKTDSTASSTVSNSKSEKQNKESNSKEAAIG